jgi:hypothetical protein
MANGRSAALRSPLPLQYVSEVDGSGFRDPRLVSEVCGQVERPAAAAVPSPIAVRSHCGVCGTPLYLAYDGKHEFGIAVGSMENPEAVLPARHYGSEGRLSWVDVGSGLPSENTKERW